MITQEILEEAKIRYKIGMKVTPAHMLGSGESFTITSKLWDVLLSLKPGLSKVGIILASRGRETSCTHTLYYKGDWAKVIENPATPKFKVGNKVRIIPGGWFYCSPQSMDYMQTNGKAFPSQDFTYSSDLIVRSIQKAEDDSFWYEIIGYKNLISEGGLALYEEDFWKKWNLNKNMQIESKVFNSLVATDFIRYDKYCRFVRSRQLLAHKIFEGKDYFLISGTTDLWVEASALCKVMFDEVEKTSTTVEASDLTHDHNKCIKSDPLEFPEPIILKKTPSKKIITI